jgi:magnesium transporter
MAWIGLYRPSEGSYRRCRAVRPVRAGGGGCHRCPPAGLGLSATGTLFVVLRAARYLDESEEVEFGELHVFTGPGFVLTVRHAESPNLAAVRQRMERPDLLRWAGNLCLRHP